jgi:hypothetical protein
MPGELIRHKAPVGLLPQPVTAPVDGVQIAMIIFAAAGVQANAESPETDPVDRAGQPLQLALRHPPEDSGVVGLGQQRFQERNLQLSGFGGDFARRRPLLFQPLVDPRYEEQVPQPRLDRARAREQVIGKRVPDRAQSQLVARLALLEQREDPLRPFALGGVEVQPCEGRFHRISEPYTLAPRLLGAGIPKGPCFRTRNSRCRST